jgi:hypothetical protein
MVYLCPGGTFNIKCPSGTKIDHKIEIELSNKGKERILLINMLISRNTTAILVSFCLLSSWSFSAFAETFKLPEKNPVVSFILPDSWKPTPTDAGLEAVSVDNEIYIAVEFVDADSVNDMIDGTFTFLDQKGVKVEKKPKSEGDSTLNTMAISHLSFNGTDKDGPCEISLSFLTVSPGKGIMITYWGSQDAADKHKESLEKILGSLTKI